MKIYLLTLQMLGVKSVKGFSEPTQEITWRETAMTVTSLRILEDLPHYSDEELKTLLGLLTLNCYGEEVSNEVAEFAISERKRRKALEEAA